MSTKRSSTAFKTVDFFRLIRISNLLIVLCIQYLVRLFVIGPLADFQSILLEKEIFLIAVGTVLIAAAGYIINDYYDIKIDVVNKPKRVVIGRGVSRRMAIMSNAVLNVIALCIGYYLSFNIALFFSGCIFLLWLYSNWLKRIAFWGNFSVAILTALSIFELALYYKEGFNKILVLSVFAFFISLIREIIKDAEDIEGDARHGAKTLPAVLGLRKTRNIILMLTMAFIILLVGLSWLYLADIFWVLLASNLPLLVLLIVKVRTADKKADFGFLSTFCKIIMLVGSASIIFIPF